MVVRAARYDVVTACDECARHCCGVFLYGQGVAEEVVVKRLAERYGLGGYNVFERPALVSGEHGGVDKR